MNKAKILAIVVAIAMLAGVLSGCFGCGNADSIVGTWQVVAVEQSGEVMYQDDGQIHVFNDDGTGYTASAGFTNEFEWVVDGAELTKTFGDFSVDYSTRTANDRLYLTWVTTGGDGQQFESVTILERVTGNRTAANNASELNGAEPLVFELTAEAEQVVGVWEVLGHVMDGEMQYIADEFGGTIPEGFQQLQIFYDDGSGTMISGTEMNFEWSVSGDQITTVAEGFATNVATFRIDGDRLYKDFGTMSTLFRRVD